MSTLLLTARDIKGLINMRDTIEAVEKAFLAFAAGDAAMPAKSYVQVEKGDFRAMPASLPGAVALKWVNVHPANPGIGLPTVMAVLIYSDPDTGYPLAVMDATEITAYRTGAAAAIASKYMARKDSQTLGLIGAGRQAHTQLMAHVELFNLKVVRVYDFNGAAVTRLMKAFPEMNVQAVSLEEAAASDIVCTVTPAHQPVLMKKHIGPGTHINAIGADAEGKEELEPAILQDAIVVVDDLVQASRAGEINIPLSKGVYKLDQVFATLAEIVSKKKELHRDLGVVTVFDSTGIAIEDVATARIIYDRAIESGGFLAVDIIGQ